MLAGAHAIPEAVQWHEGMLLSPQHFQVAARRTESLIAYLIDSVVPFAWGVQRFIFDASALLSGLFRVIELEAVLPDGMLALYPISDDAPLEIDLKIAGPNPRLAPVTVHIAVAGRTEHAIGPGALQRYRSVEGQPIADENTGDGEISVPRLRPVLGLYVTQDTLQAPPIRYVSLPLARIAFREESYVLDVYEPPCLTLTKDNRLYKCSRAIAVELRERSLALGERLQSSRLQGIEARDTALQLQLLIRGLPRLEALLQSGHTHPYSIYLALCDVVGDLAVINGQLNLPTLSGYEHRDPLCSFEEVSDYVQRAVGMLRETFRTVRFTRLEAGRFGLLINSAWISEFLFIGVRIGSGQAPDHVRAWIENAIIASNNRMRNVRENRVLGADRTLISEAPELDLLAPPNVLLYRVMADPFAIVVNEQLLIAGPLEERNLGEPAEVLLYLPAQLAADATARP